MTYNLRYILPIAVVAIATAFAIAVFSWSHVAYGNPSFYNRFQTAANATSTVSHLQPGAGTTTLTAVNSINSAFDSATVNLQVTATSTGVVGQVLLNVRVEGSMDNVDWYPIAIQANSTLGGAFNSATTTLLTTNPYWNMQLALSTSTTPAGDFGGTGDKNHIFESFTIPTSEKHLRVIFEDPQGGGKYGLWAEIVTKQQAN